MDNQPKGRIINSKTILSKKINPGKWSIIGGAVKAGESSDQGGIREVAEEICLKLNPCDIKLLSRSFGKDIIFDDYVVILEFALS